ncbi:unnamed protein product [Mytilus coruscus]|uniref:Uncharacterized protein n=1 Tax=Mytilus coruscus TaxID=42192 RepID=A0A6J8BTL3_MYTCO|nr:unnamed protein product [Mytilus coruscus]
MNQYLMFQILKPQQIEFEAALIASIASKIPETDSTRESYSIENFKDCFASAIKVNQIFNVEELKVILSLTCSPKPTLKANLVNLISSIYGDESTIAVGGKKPKSLKNIASAHIRKWSINAINVAIAQSTFEDAFRGMQFKSPFSRKLDKKNGWKMYKIQQWYGQPSMINDQYIQPIIDPHHLFVNNRSRCCSKGLTGYIPKVLVENRKQY